MRLRADCRGVCWQCLARGAIGQTTHGGIAVSGPGSRKAGSAERNHGVPATPDRPRSARWAFRPAAVADGVRRIT